MSSLINLLLVAAALASIAVIVASRRSATVRASRTGMVFCAAPSFALLGLFYALVIHMHYSLEAWPRSLGENGLPAGLVIHAELATRCFSALLLATLLVWPAGFLACLLFRASRRWATYLGVHALAFALCVGFMGLAPQQFLYWWWD